MSLVHHIKQWRCRTPLYHGAEHLLLFTLQHYLPYLPYYPIYLITS